MAATARAAAQMIMIANITVSKALLEELCCDVLAALEYVDAAAITLR